MLDPGKPTLYLDFDGVLHRFGEPAFDENFQLVDNPRLFEWRPILERLIEPWVDVQIIVSSDWSRLFDDDALVSFLGPVLGLRFVGVLEVVDSARANGIGADAARRGFTQWIALDDHPSVIAASKSDPRFIACDSQTGLSDPDVQEMLRAQFARFLREAV